VKIYKIPLIFLISCFAVVCLSWLPAGRCLSQTSHNFCDPEENCPVTKPLYNQINRYSVTIPANGDAADIYYPVAGQASLNAYPLGLLFPGSNVDKYYYNLFARKVASYGFVIVVPNHVISNKGKTELFAQVQQVTDILAFMKTENINHNSPIFHHLDVEKLVLLGHSHGAFIGFDAIRNVCESPWCEGNYQRPKELLAGVFYGADFWENGKFLTIDNSRNPGAVPPLTSENLTVNQAPSYPGIPLALIVGSRDSLIKAENVRITYDYIKQPPKAYIKITGANHYGITDIDNPPESPREKNPPTLPQQEAIEAIARWSALFLRAYALNDSKALDYIHTEGTHQEPNVTVISKP
jgi:predicted dienelactone hydrolase